MCTFNAMRLRWAPLWLGISLACALAAGCSRNEPEAAPPQSAEGDGFAAESELDPSAPDNPEYAAAKAALAGGDAPRAIALLRKLVDAASPPVAAYANDLGVALLLAGSAQEAAAAFRTATGIDSRYERAHFNLGVALSRLGQAAEAEEAWREATRINPFYYEAWYNLGLALYRRHALEEARTAFLAITENTRSARFHRAYYQLGLIAAQSNEDGDAVRYYEESILLNPAHVPSYLNQAAALLRLQLPDKARAALSKAAALEPGNPLIHWNLGLSWLADGNDPKAREAFNQTVALDPEYAPAYTNLAAIALRASQPLAARDLLLTAIQLDPQNTSILWNLGLAEAGLQRDQEAARWFSQVLAADPQHPQASLNLAAALIRLGQLEQADFHLQQAESLNADDFRIAWNRGLIAQRRDDEAGARRAFEAVIERAPDYQPALFNLGLIDFRNNAFTAARDWFHRAAHLAGGDPYPEALYMLGKCHSELGEFNAAINAYEAALRLRPDYAEAAFNLALNLQRAGDQDAAMRLYRELADSASATPEALNNLAAQYLADRKEAEAIPLLQRAIDLDPGYATATYNLALAHLRMEDFAAAIGQFTATVRLSPEHFAAWKNLGIAHARQGDFENALRAMRTAFELNPADADTAVYVVRYLKQLEADEAAMTEVYQRAYANGARNPLILGHLAGAASDSGNDEAAVGFLRAYLELRPSPTHAFNLGLALRRLNRFDEARTAYQQAISLRPDYPKAWLNLGYILVFLSDRDAGAAAFRKALEQDPEYQNAKDALRDLEANLIHP